MKKDTRPIEIQVAELTDEQKRNIPRIFYGHLALAVALILMLLGVIAFFHFQTAEAYETYDIMEQQFDINMNTGKFTSPDFLDEKWDAYDRWERCLQAEFISAAAGGIILLVVALLMQLLSNILFPYYSDKKFFYLSKIKKQPH